VGKPGTAFVQVSPEAIGVALMNPCRVGTNFSQRELLLRVGGAAERVLANPGSVALLFLGLGYDASI
jgi:hypothetical protein